MMMRTINRLLPLYKLQRQIKKKKGGGRGEDLSFADYVRAPVFSTCLTV